MTRRTFLKGMAQASLVALASLPLSLLPAGTHPDVALAAQTNLGGITLRGTRDGLILQLPAGGTGWQKIANFGSHCSILAIVQRQGQVYVTVGIQGYSFFLRSPDTRTWWTTDAIPPAV